MARYEVSVVTPAAATGAAYATIHTAASDVARILEIGAFTTAATASRIAVGRKNNVPVATTSVLGQAVNTVDAVSVTNVDTAWSTAPTAPAQFFRRYSAAAAIGAGVIWRWDAVAPLLIPVSDWLVIWNDGAATAAALALYVSWEE